VNENERNEDPATTPTSDIGEGLYGKPLDRVTKWMVLMSHDQLIRDQLREESLFSDKELNQFDTWVGGEGALSAMSPEDVHRIAPSAGYSNWAPEELAHLRELRRLDRLKADWKYARSHASHTGTSTAQLREDPPPGKFLERIAEFWFSAAKVNRVLKPVIIDMRREYSEALRQQRPAKALWVRIRGTSAFWSSTGLLKLFEKLGRYL
jgi:hypothetical protein